MEGCYPALVHSLARTFALSSLLLAPAACGHKAPYRTGEQPSADALMEQTTPQLPAIAVPDAQITLDRVARADLQMLAQTDARFRASVTKAGNELVTLAFSEDGYAMRYKLDQIPTGFYEGPADPCAVQAVLGVPLSYDGLVSLVLGGAPLVEGATLVKQKWDRKKGYEVLTLAGSGFVQDLWFAWMDGAWVFAGGQMWEGTAEKRGRWLWTLEHDRHQTVDGVILPGRTKVRAPGKRRNHLIVLAYKERVANPPWATSAPSSSDSGGPGDSGDDGGDSGDWEDNGDWEDEGGWEDEEPAEPPPAQTPAAPSGVLAAVIDASAPATAPSTVPGVFKIEANGLPNRGDLCK